ncbi:hypothetical protein D623_10031974 [Myotis brandtii]|uniref:Uncharacterized protein n=1 Tax=Myotis brandtii TaxID=109478 RepID=S7MVP2_MYOBR|nr:hypothetical protein D623_10031974 [Myotis brandtii]
MQSPPLALGRLLLDPALLSSRGKDWAEDYESLLASPLKPYRQECPEPRGALGCFAGEGRDNDRNDRDAGKRVDPSEEARIQLFCGGKGRTGLRVPSMNRDVPEVPLTGGDLVPQGHTRRCLSVVESREQLEEEEEEEGKKKERDGFHAVPLRRSGAFRAHNHSYDPFKRHSWGPDREPQDQLSSCSQLERGSDTWVGSSLRRTFSFLWGMTGKAKLSSQLWTAGRDKSLSSCRVD